MRVLEALRGSVNAVGQRDFCSGACMRCAQHLDGCNGGQSEIGGHDMRDGRQTQHANSQLLPGGLHRAQVDSVEMLQSQHQHLARHYLTDCVGMGRKLVTDRGANAVAAVAVKPFSDQQRLVPEQVRD
jgi:hypothetical protein